ncbi:RluA family pseudouridine synthase [Shumkonia mesophila]|uniref:RluA family pseudouridine synthase n=1 Tax=Shumkonia mesophila TaxID=2838854 RepID=UPI00293513F4|nr:RluA family pseudouridine synthase [Shumkonia mesophila]
MDERQDAAGGVRILEVAGDEAGARLDRWFKRHFPNVAHGKLEKLLRTGQVRVDGRRAKSALRLEAGQKIRVPPVNDAPLIERPAAPVRIPDRALDDLRAAVLHKDDDVLVINKAPGLAVQGGTKTDLHVDAMLDALRFDSPHRPRLVHRLDKDTSGVLLLARNPAAAAALAAAFRSKTAQKLYWAIVVGVPRPSMGRIDLPLEKVAGPRGEHVVADDGEGKRAATLFRVVDHVGRRAAWVALSPLTGRTHQLRVHMAAIGTPIVGDGKYGGAEAFLGGDIVSRRLHLHARAIRLPHPKGGELVIAAPAPAHFAATLGTLGFEADGTADYFFSDLAV